MKIKKLLSGFLAFIMLMSAAVNFSLPVFAEADSAGSASASDEETEIDYLTEVFITDQEKLQTMDLMAESDRYQLYAEPNSGEVAYLDKATGQALFTNPYNINDISASTTADTKALLMSQVVLTYMDNGQEYTMNSYTEAADRNQIVVKNIKNGIRVEYTMGRVDSKRLLPRYIEKSRYEQLIYEVLGEIDDGGFIRDRFNSFYTLRDLSTVTSESLRLAMLNEYPITERMAIYTITPNASEKELDTLEGYIKQYVPRYTYDDMEYDHDMTGYVGTDKVPAVFRLAIEYYLEDDGLRVRVPVNGVRFDESTYQLSSLQILPYFGAAQSMSDGYAFMPDGSGTIIRFEDFYGEAGKAVTGKVYGEDYAFYQISSGHQNVFRLPVYGIAESIGERDVDTIVGRVIHVYSEVDGTEVETRFDGEIPDDIRERYPNAIDLNQPEEETDETTDETGEETSDEENSGSTGSTVTGNTVEVIEYIYETTHVDAEEKGYFAIIEEGDAIAEIKSETGGRVHAYNTISTTLYPRPTDTYNISDAITAASSAVWTVQSKRKYTGNFTVRYVMLNDDTRAAEGGLTEDEYYENSYMGMVNIYRDYLERNGILERLTEEDVQEDIPLYIESFGTIDTTQKILSFPVTVSTPLTTFSDLKEMSSQLQERGITNINYRLTGFFNGGMESAVPYKTNVEGKVGGSSGFKDFMSYATEQNIGVYPDFDFVFANNTANGWFSGLNSKNHLIKAMDDRYAQKREYSSMTQTYESTFLNIISPSCYQYFYEKFSENYNKLNPIGVSVSTLGSYLTSDFDKEDAYHREDSKEYAEMLFESLQQDYGRVMTDSGNLYSLKYVTDVLNMPLDSSDYVNASATIPFMGMVLHGYLNYAVEALNTVGDIDYAILRAIENGAGAYFLLSYENTSELKTATGMSKYYSVSFSIWLEDMVEAYNKLNNAIKDLQTERIVDHEFLVGERVVTDEELEEIKEEAARVEAEKAAKEEAERLAREEAERLAELLEQLQEEELIAAGRPVVEIPTFEEPEEEDEPVEEMDELTKRLTVDNDKIVKVTYENGTYFILNYNNYSVKVDGVEIGALDFVRYE